MSEAHRHRPPTGHRRNLSTEITETARLELVIPHATDLNMAEVISPISYKTAVIDRATPNIPAVARIEQRSHLFYDEKLPVFIVLQNIVPLSDELYEHYLARLAVSLEVAAIDGSQSPQGYPGRGQDNVHMLFQTVINEKDTPRILAGDATKRLAIWKLEVPLGHPRARLSNPRVIITCSATLRPAELQKPLFEDEYITSRQPMGINLLESFIEDTSVPGTVVPPRLSAHRVSRVIPATPAPQEMLRPLGYAAKRSFDIYPAINIRLRYSRIPAGGKQIVIASLDLEVTPFSDCRVTIESVDITVLGGHAELLADTPTAVLPVTCRPRDDMTFLYKIRQDPTVEASSAIPGIAATTVTTTPSQIHSISVNLMATALVSAVCRPRIETHWTTTVDFAPPTVHQFGATAPSGISRPHRPASLGSIIHGATVQASSGIRPSLTPGSALSPKVVFTPPTDSRNFGAPHMPQEPPMPTPDPANHGLTVTFTGPSRVYVGEVFAWSVFVVNRSNRLRKLALVLPPPRRKKAEVTGKPSLPSPLAGDPPEPVVDDTLVAGSHRAGFLEPAELLALSNDIRIGPLVPSACHTAELKFVPLTTGLLRVEGVRVVDLNSNETTDCRDLPSIVSVGKRG